MSEMKTSHVAACALALSALSLAVVAAWVWAGANVPSPAALPAIISPLTGMMFLTSREGLDAVAAAIAWTLAFDIALSVVVVVLLFARTRQSPVASRLGLAIALIAAGFTTLFFLLSLAPFDAWAVMLRHGASQATAVVATGLGIAILGLAGIALILLGAWTLFRFWLAYPAIVDLAAVAEFALARRMERAFYRANVAMLVRRKPSEFAIRILKRSIATWFSADASDRPLHSPLGGWFTTWSLVAVCGWTAASLALPALAEGTSRWMRQLFMMVALLGVVPIAHITWVAMERIADVVSYQYRFAGERDHYRIEWLHAAGTFARFASDNAFFILVLGFMVWITFETFVLERSESSVEFAHWVVAFLFPLLVAPAFYILGLAASMLARGLIDPRLALRKITLWMALGVLVTIVFVAIERLLALQIARWLSLPADSGPIIAGAIAAVTFLPLRGVIERWVNRYVERRMPVRELAEGERRTGAVAVVDISGFTALTTQDESAALLATTLLQRESKRLADAHEGRVVKSTGDGVLLAFADAPNAIASVRELYAEFARMRESLSLPPIALHSGLHWGEYVDVRGADIYGHTVNLASRLADAAGPSEIVASAEFASALGAVEPAPVPLGTKRFKNVAEPVACVRM